MKLDGYQVEDEIARGAQGIVYAARHHTSGQRVAIKLLLQVSPSLLQRFEREAEVLARLKHPNVVTIHGAGRTQGRPYIVMELVEGLSLERALAERGVFEPREAARLVRDLARGAGQAHREGLVHRDIKPANALLRPDGTVLLSDFGLARDQESKSDLSKTGIFMGTPGFASPEQAAGEGKRVGPASDVYGLGALLFALLCDRPPVEGDLLEVVVATLSTPPPSPREFNEAVDLDLATICLRCLAKSPEERYPDGGALADELDRYLSGENIAEAQARRSAPALALLGLLTVTGLGGATLYAAGLDEPSLALESPPPSASPTASTQASSSIRPQATPTPDPSLERTLRLVRAKTRPDELDSAIEILSEALERAERASNRRPSELFLAVLHARRADQVMRRGPSEVSADLRRAAALDPTPERRAALAEALLREGLHLNGDLNRERWPPARELLREAVQLAPQELRMPLELGEQARVRKDWETAQAGFAEAYRRDPNSDRAATGLAHTLGRLGRAPEGVAVVRGFLARHPKNDAAKLRLGRLLSRQERWAESRVAFESVNPKSGARDLARLGLAWIALEEDRPSLAWELVEGIPDKEFEVSAVQGIVHLRRGALVRAAAALQGVVDMEEPDPRMMSAYLEALQRRGKLDQAAEVIGKLVEARSMEPAQVLLFQVDHFARRGAHGRAKKALQNLYRLLRGLPDAWTALQAGHYCSQWGRYHDPKLAEQLAKIAASAAEDDEDARAWVLEGKALLLQFRYDEARTLLARAIEAHPTRVDAHHQLASVEGGARRYEASIAAARRCLELEPSSAYSAVIGAEACLGAERFAEAKPFLAVCHEHLPENVLARSLQAVMHVELGQLEAAEADVAWLVERDRHHRHSQLAQASLHVARGRPAEARALALPLSRRPDRGWLPSYAKLLLKRAAAR